MTEDKQVTDLEKLELLRAKKKKIIELKKFKKELQTEQEKMRLSIIKNEKANKILYLGHEGKGYLGNHGTWEFNPLQRRFLEAFMNTEKKVFIYSGANRIGKTFISFCLLYSMLCGKYPWDKDMPEGHIWKIRGWKPPIKIRWIGQDWEKQIKGVLIPKINELWPKNHPLKIKKNQVGTETFFTEQRLGSTFEIMSNRQEAALHEGWNGEAILYDEPPKREIRIASSRGLVDTNGVEIFSMTLLNESWIYNDVVNKTDDKGQLDRSIFRLDGTMADNIGYGITQEGMQQFAKTLSPEEYQARIEGKSLVEISKVLNIKRDVHIIDRFDIPINWIFDISIDIGQAKPHDILYVATSPRGFKYVCFEEQVRGGGEAIGASIAKKIQRYNMRVNHIICDPLAKSDQNNENTVWAKIDMVLMQYNYFLEKGDKDKEDGVIIINQLLSSEFGEPCLYFFRDCVRAILQCDGWIRDEDGTIKKYKSSQLPGDDQAENLYRIALLETVWEEPYVEEENLIPIPKYVGNEYTGGY